MHHFTVKCTVKYIAYSCCCCCCLALPAPSWSAETARASALRRTPVYLGVGFPWLPLIESRDEPKGPGESQGHCGRIPQISWVAHSSISSLPSKLRTLLKDMRNRLMALPTPSASRVNLWTKTTFIWAESQMMPTLQASKMHSFLSMQVCLVWIHRRWGFSQKSVRRCTG